MTTPSSFDPPTGPSGALALPPLPPAGPSTSSAGFGSAPTAGFGSTSSVPLAEPPTTSSWGGSELSGSAQVPDTTRSFEAIEPPGAPEARDTVRAPRRGSTALVLATLSLVGSLALLGWGCYDLLASVRVLDVVTQGAPIINKGDLLMIAVGAVLAAVACVLALVATFRWRPIAAPAALLVLALALPLAVTLFSVVRGGEEFKTRNLADIASYQESATQVAASVDVEQVEATLDQLEAFGITVPGKQEIIQALREAQDRQAEP